MATTATSPVVVSCDLRPSAKVVVAGFTYLGVGIRSLREPLKQAIQQVLSPSFRRHFDEEGPGWAPLSESRLAQKDSAGYPSDILTATGRLKRVAGQLNIWNINGGYGSGEAVGMVTSLPGAEYGQFHTTGTYKMPAREFLYATDEDVDKIERVFSDYVEMRIRRAGF